MENFFCISHNSFYKNGFPWLERIVEGLIRYPKCALCQGDQRYPEGEISVTLQKDKGVKWPDILGCGHGLLFIVSRRVLDAWRNEGIGTFPAHRVHFLEPYPKKLVGIAPPDFYWLDGKKLRGAAMDLEASGFVNGSFCGQCGRLLHDVAVTYVQQHEKVWPYAFKQGSWNGLKLFTTDKSAKMFFCTAELINCARKHRFLNFRFTPAEEGIASSSKGLDYLGRSFRL